MRLQTASQFRYAVVADSVEDRQVAGAQADVRGETVVSVVLVLDDVDTTAEGRLQLTSQTRDPLEALIGPRAQIGVMCRPALGMRNQEVQQDAKRGIGNLKPRVPDHH